MVKRILLALVVVALAAPFLSGQAVSTASRRADLQIGVGYVGVNSDYDPNKLKGFGLYTTLDLTNHFGGEFVFHQANTSQNDQLYERTYEIGPRYHRDYGRFSPYIKAMYGRGVFNFPYNVANLAYNMFTGGVGVDIHIKPYLNVRADYEYQKWLSFPPNGLSPQLIMIGVAYRFPGALKRGRHY